jgi:hypothetical protein
MAASRDDAGAIARTLAQIERFKPSDDFGRRMKALNLTQAKTALARLNHPSKATC